MAQITIQWTRGRECRIVERRVGRTLAEDPDQEKGDRAEQTLACEGRVIVTLPKAATLYERLAACGTAEDAQSFASKYGLLRHAYAEPVADFLRDARTVRDLLAEAKEAQKADEWEPVRQRLVALRKDVKLDYALGADDAGRTQPHFRASTLFAFIVTALVGDLTQGRHYHRCDNPSCERDQYFYFGAGTGHRQRQPGQPWYCSPTCRAAHAYEKRKQKEQ